MLMLMFFLNQFGIPGLLKNWIMPNEQYGAILCTVCQFFYCFTSPQLQLFRRMQQHRFAVRRQKCFADHENYNNFPLAWGWVDSDYIFVFGCTYPLMSWSLTYSGRMNLQKRNVMVMMKRGVSQPEERSSSLVRCYSMTTRFALFHHKAIKTFFFCPQGHQNQQKLKALWSTL